MTLATMAKQYIRHKQDLGVRFKTDAMHLECFFDFLRTSGENGSVSAEIVSKFLWQGSRTVAYWRRKYAVLNGFNRFLSGHGYSQVLPLPKEKPHITPPFVPYVLDHYELARFFAALPSTCESRSVSGNVARLFFMLLYGTGLRVGEALGLTPQAVDAEQALLTVRATKFYKTRLVPVAPLLQRELAAYDRWKRGQTFQPEPSAYFIDKRGLPLRDHQVRTLFEISAINAGSERQNRARDLVSTISGIRSPCTDSQRGTGAERTCRSFAATRHLPWAQQPRFNSGLSHDDARVAQPRQWTV